MNEREQDALLEWAWAREVGSSSEKHVLVGICIEVARGKPGVSVDYLAGKTQLNRKTVMRAAAALERQGVISVVKRKGAKNIYVPQLTPNETSTRIGTNYGN